MRKLMSFALVAAVPLGVAVLVRGIGASHAPHVKRRRGFWGVKRRFGRQAGAFGEAIRDTMQDLRAFGHKN